LKITTATVGCFVAVAVAGCGAFETKKKGGKADEIETELTGTWRQECIGVDFLEIANKKDAYTFSALGDFERKLELYSGDNCEDLQGTLRSSGTYSVVGDAEDVDDAQNLNFTVREMTLEPESDDLARALSAAKYCGVKDWSVDKEVSLVSRDCAGESVDEGEVVFDIYNVEDDVLYLGNANKWFDKTDASDRPDELDTDHPFNLKD
jgi:hypothetical protein